MSSGRSALCLALALACATGALAMDRPVAPSGFTWHDVTEIRAAFLVPDGWHVREEHQDKTFALFITETAFSPPAEFEVGLTVNVFRNTPGAAAKVKQVFDAIAAKYSVKVTPGTSGPFRTLSCHFDSKPASGKEPVRQFQLGIANPKTGTAYLLIFESPVSRWDAAWAKGKPILDALALETEI